ncbi:hypothetical protein KY285_013462 [Solanum tuberosum]|nr:hypothetical protein KY285_013462 [Solanum tuberosum]
MPSLKARDLKILTMDELIGNLQTYELNKQQDLSKKDGKREKFIALKASPNDASKDDQEMAYLTRRFLKIVKKHGGFREGKLQLDIKCK